jgi:hypothetical protein
MRPARDCEQALVDVADLLDIQRPVRQPLRFSRAGPAAPAPQHLERIQLVQHGPVIDRDRLGPAFTPGLRPSRNGNRAGSNRPPP